MISEPVAVIGIGAAGAAELSPAARGHIERARVLVGGKRQLGYFPDWLGERIVLEGELAPRLQKAAELARTQKTVVLASGDPLYFGIGRALLEVFAKDELIFLPQLSSVQLAFARLKETWHDACVISLHGRPLHALVAALQRGEPKIALLSDPANDPLTICKLVCAAGFADQYALWICEEMGAPTEKVTQVSLRNPPESSFSPLNVVILLRWGTSDPGAGLPPLVGIPDESLQKPAPPQVDVTREALKLLVEHRLSAGALEQFLPSRGLFTRKEVRLLALSQLELRPDDVFWDIGTGSGSVAIEAARLSPRLSVHAIDRNAAACCAATDNALAFGLINVRCIEGEAPESLQLLPEPDAIFIGGSGGRLADILTHSMERLRRGGRLVLNCITLETMSLAWTWLKEHGFEPEVLSVQLARSRPLGDYHCLEPEHPISILKARKQ